MRYINKPKPASSETVPVLHRIPIGGIAAFVSVAAALAALRVRP